MINILYFSFDEKFDLGDLCSQLERKSRTQLAT
jgi:hypothetical protein